MSKKISIREVAKLAGVSTATVSNVYSGKKYVQEELARRVRAAGEQLGYKINRAASQLRSGKNSVVAVLVPDLSDPFFTSIITQLEALARVDGYEIIVANSNDNMDVEHGRLDALLSWQPAGLVVIPCSDDIPPRLLETNDLPPFVISDRVTNMNLTDTVTIDNQDAGAIAAKYVAEAGHKHVLIAASNLKIAPIRQRCLGVETIIKQFNGHTQVIEVGTEPRQGSKILTEWIERNKKPTAIIAMTDMATLAVLKCLAHRKIDIPEQISVVGFDDYPWMGARRTGITAVSQPVEEIAQSIWESLHTRMQNNDADIKNKTLKCSLKIRQSVKTVSKKGDTASKATSYLQEQELLDETTMEEDNDYKQLH